MNTGYLLALVAALMVASSLVPWMPLRAVVSCLSSLALVFVYLHHRRALARIQSALAAEREAHLRHHQEMALLESAHREAGDRRETAWQEKWEAARQETLERVGLLSGLLAQIPPHLHDKTFSLDVLLQQLASVRNQIESSATTLATSFFEIHAKAKRQSQKAETVMASLSGDAGESREGVLSDTKAALESLVRHVREAGAVYHQSLTSVTRITEHTTGIEGHIKSIEVIADRTNVLAINAGIEAARSGVHGKGFNVVAQEVRRLSGLTENTADEIQKILRQMVSLTREVHREFEAGGQAMVALADQAESVFQTTVAQINSIMENARTEMAGLKEDAASLARNTSQAVVSMQFHDIIRQRVEHVLQPLTEVRAQLVAIGTELRPHLGAHGGPRYTTDKTAQWLSGFYTMKEEQDVLQAAMATSKN